MGKVAPEPQIPQRTHSGRSYWVRNILSPTRDDPDPGAKGQAAAPSNPMPTKPTPAGQSPAAQTQARKRFVEPYRLSEEQRAAMLAPLAERGVGDAESRELFAAALAYDLATCYELTVANPDPEHVEPTAPTAAAQVPAKAAGRKAAASAPKVPAELADLARTAITLATRLEALEADTRTRLLEGLREGDRFCRGYDEDYLGALRGEILRLASSVGTVGVAQEVQPAEPPTPAPPKRVAPPKPSPAARQFIARAAGAFEECFDQAPTAQVSGPFTALLKALVQVTGVRIPTDARNLAELLKRA